MAGRLALIFLVLGLALASCSPESSDVPSQISDNTASSTQASTTPGSDTTGPVDIPGTTEPAGPTTTMSDREVAPDFTLELGDGGSYTLSQGEKPVYLVFWAEW